jgi:hypothetical protein
VINLGTPQIIYHPEKHDEAAILMSTVKSDNNLHMTYSLVVIVSEAYGIRPGMNLFQEKEYKHGERAWRKVTVRINVNPIN